MNSLLATFPLHWLGSRKQDGQGGTNSCPLGFQSVQLLSRLAVWAQSLGKLFFHSGGSLRQFWVHGWGGVGSLVLPSLWDHCSWHRLLLIPCVWFVQCIGGPCWHCGGEAVSGLCWNVAVCVFQFPSLPESHFPLRLGAGVGRSLVRGSTAQASLAPQHEGRESRTCWQQIPDSTDPWSLLWVGRIRAELSLANNRPGVQKSASNDILVLLCHLWPAGLKIPPRVCKCEHNVAALVCTWW